MSSESPSTAFTGYPPLSLYVHLPWCVRKCPYCDFNSHNRPGQIPAAEYAAALLADLDRELPDVWGRPVHSVFFGGGTPSLFTAAWYEKFLGEVRARLALAPDVEITLEANPGTTEHDSFERYAAAGINRVSLGVQSFDDALLQAIGRIHGRAEVERSLESIHRSGIENFNVDLMFALPGQNVPAAVEDVRRAIAAGAAHVSHYQLTLEPNTAFHADPPPLPDPDGAWDMQEGAMELLVAAGYRQYEVSAWAQEGRQCRHNLNYWTYGDFLGIGAGAHSKITLPAVGSVRRRIRKRHPTAYLQAVQDGGFVADERILGPEERIFEFFLNQLRLYRGVDKAHFTARTGLSWETVAERVQMAVDRGLLQDEGSRLAPTELGWRFSNETQEIFLP
jgi:oxygen-independent coproporphyrinogen-3 oxidase